MALSFRDCHTKIRHVDAHATLNEGVVVQVMGELSNNMQPMRKFMQTFVLAPEVCTSPPLLFSPVCEDQQLIQCLICFFLQGTVANKFYVHNDVFRYQDEVFGDSDSEPPEGETVSAGCLSAAIDLSDYLAEDKLSHIDRASVFELLCLYDRGHC